MIWGQLNPHIHMPKLLRDAFANVSRLAFVPARYQESCYHDDHILLTEKDQKSRFLLSPLTLGKILVHADLETAVDKKALILCGGTGYSAALFGQMDIDCVMVEIRTDLADQATENLTRYSKISVRAGPFDTIDSILEADSFDLILIDGGAIETIPPFLLDRLKPTGFILALQQQAVTCLDSLSLCWGVKIPKGGTQSILFDAGAPLNQDFTTLPSFHF
jgi:protein-L-isoaspartate O-methyltransferase